MVCKLTTPNTMRAGVLALEVGIAQSTLSRWFKNMLTCMGRECRQRVPRCMSDTWQGSCRGTEPGDHDLPQSGIEPVV